MSEAEIGGFLRAAAAVVLVVALFVLIEAEFRRRYNKRMKEMKSTANQRIL